MKKDAGPGRPCEIVRFVHCGRCAQERAKEKLSFGLTPTGFQVWCKRHGNLVHLEFDEPPDIPPCQACIQGVPHEHGPS